MPSLLQVWALPCALLAIANISVAWYNKVSEHVPDPYLDEVFHVPQAQRYCRNDYSWDPKITTPPGLYLASVLIQVVVGCKTSTLRALNVGAICLICLVSYSLLQSLHKKPTSKQEKEHDDEASPLQQDEDQVSLLTAHTALNISLFPPLFFFSALYYTDVMSTLIVLLNYSTFLKRKDTKNVSLNNVALVVVGVIALLFRQTNIFWVAVFPAALAVVDALKEAQGPSSSEHQDFRTTIERSWSHGDVYDCCVETTGPQDFLLFFISLALAALKHPALVFRTVLPYIFMLNLFAWFVAWNGSVVLGDKSAHTATIHLPQMLYFWPYVVFFSLPLSIGSLLSTVVSFLPDGLKFLLENIITITSTGKSKSAAKVPGIIAAILFIGSGLVAVHYNTVVHPYTLADNRHYVFYAFRILRKHQAIKYAAVPFYYICACITFQTLGSNSPNEVQVKPKPKENKPASPQSNLISFVVAWFATTALSVVTAPLVEPRYFIIPWIIWRLHVPYLSQPAQQQKKGSDRGPYSIRLVLETLWLLAVNAAIGYRFLYQGFAWPQEPGKIQRFLW